VIKEAFFPTFIYAKDINLDLNLLTNAIVEWSKKDKGLTKTNVKGWHSQTNMHTIPVFKPLVDELYKMQHKIYEEEFLRAMSQDEDRASVRVTPDVASYNYA